MKKSELKAIIREEIQKLNEANYTRRGGNGVHYKWIVILNNGKKKTVNADSIKSVKAWCLETDDLIIGVKSIIKKSNNIVKPALK